MTIRMVDAAYRALRRRYAELELRRMTAEELAEWYSVGTQMTEAELEYPDGSYRPIAAVADAESYDFELHWAGATA